MSQLNGRGLPRTANDCTTCDGTGTDESIPGAPICSPCLGTGLSQPMGREGNAPITGRESPFLASLAEALGVPPENIIDRLPPGTRPDQVGLGPSITIQCRPYKGLSEADAASILRSEYGLEPGQR